MNDRDSAFDNIMRFMDDDESDDILNPLDHFTEEQIDKVTEVYSSRRGHVFEERMETLVDLLSLAKESVKSEQYQKSTTEYEKAKKVLFEIVIKPLILFILNVKKYDKTVRKKMFEEYSSKTYDELLDMAKESINELKVHFQRTLKT